MLRSKLSLLNQTTLQKTDPKLYQFLKELLADLGDVETDLASSEDTNTTVNIKNEYIINGLASEGDNNDYPTVIPGPVGPTGLVGLQGIPGVDGLDGNDGIGIPGIRGNDGATGAPGASGQLIVIENYDSSEDNAQIVPGIRGETGATGSAGSGGGGSIILADNNDENKLFDDYPVTDPQGSRYTKLYDNTLTNNAASINIVNISQGYNILEVLFIARTDEVVVSSTISITFNTDTGANYYRQVVRAINTTVAGVISTAAVAYLVDMAGASCAAGICGILRMSIPSYNQTTFRKTMEITSGKADTTAANGRSETTIVTWNSTAAISTITFTAAAGKNMVAGTRVLIYGR